MFSLFTILYAKALPASSLSVAIMQWLILGCCFKKPITGSVDVPPSDSRQPSKSGNSPRLHNVWCESALHHNAVFLGKDANDKTRFAALRGTRGNFKCDAEGSNKKYGFVVPPKNLDAYGNQTNQAVMLFESPIDALSHQTLCNRGELPDFDGWRLSLGGTSTLPVIGFLEQHPNINHCIIATDNDEAGNSFADKMANKLNIAVERVHPLQGKDWNEALLQTLRPETPSHQVEHTNEQAEPDL